MNLLILGAGTGGSIVANRLQRRLPTGWRLTVVDPDDSHLYQPGLLFLPIGARDEDEITRPRARTLRADVPWVRKAVERIEPDAHRVVLKDGETLAFDLLVIASGACLRPTETTGLAEALAERSVHDFYTLEGAQALRSALERFEGGRFVVNVVEMPIKCPVAAMELLFLSGNMVRAGGRRALLRWVLSSILALLGYMPAAHASFLAGEALDKAADVLAIVILIFVPLAGIALFWMVHVLPEKIAETRHHPQQTAIKTLCLLSLVFGGMLWPLAWLWAYVKPVGYKMAYGTDKHESYFLGKAREGRAGKLPRAEAERLKAELDDIGARRILSGELRAAQAELEAALAAVAQPAEKGAA